MARLSPLRWIYSKLNPHLLLFCIYFLYLYAENYDISIDFLHIKWYTYMQKG